MNTERLLPAHRAGALVLALACVLPAHAEDKPCLECHAAIVQKMVAHKSCADCHAELVASVEPRKTNCKSAKELAVAGPSLCVNCHDKKLFEGKVVHAEVGKCPDCHDSHASDYQGLLKKEPATLCLDCHPDIGKGPHVIAGITRSGHPLGNEKKEVQDPLRPGKKYYCVSCHEPHRSEFPKLNRFAKGMASCLPCHKM